MRINRKLLSYILTASMLCGMLASCATTQKPPLPEITESNTAIPDITEVQGEETSHTVTASLTTEEKPSEIPETTDPPTEDNTQTVDPTYGLYHPYTKLLTENTDIKGLLELVPDESYLIYPGRNNRPKSVDIRGDLPDDHLFDSINMDVNDPRIIKLINFFNNMAFHKACKTTPGNIEPEYYESSRQDSLIIRVHYNSNTNDVYYSNNYDVIEFFGDENIIIARMTNSTLDSYSKSDYTCIPLNTSDAWLSLFGFDCELTNSQHLPAKRDVRVSDIVASDDSPVVLLPTDPEYGLYYPYYVLKRKSDNSGWIPDSEQLDQLLTTVPSDRYIDFPGMRCKPLSATLYKDGIATEIDVNDPRLIQLVNFYNNTIYQSYGWNFYSHADFPVSSETRNIPFRLEVVYIPMDSDTGFMMLYSYGAVIRVYAGLKSDAPFPYYCSYTPITDKGYFDMLSFFGF